MSEFLQSLNVLTSYLVLVFMFMIAVGIGTLGGFISSRMKAKDKLKLEQMKSEAAIADANLKTQLSQERQAAMELRSLQIKNGFSETYIPVLDDPEPKKKQKELK